MAVMLLEEPSTHRIPPDRFALFALGFRPFYLLGAGFAAVALPVWVLVWLGALNTPMAGIWWHAHEMLFGFAAAIVIGFLLTAGRNWTGLPTPTGTALAGLAGLWLAGRLAMALSASPWAAAIDLAFLPLAGALLLRVLLRAGSRRNYGIGLIPLLLALVNLGFHLAALGVIAADPLVFAHLALALVVLLETLIAGRVVPMFTLNALRGLSLFQRRALDLAAVGTGAVALLVWALVPGEVGGALAAAAALLHAARWLGWKPWATRRTPLLWSLHLAYGWIPLGLALLALAQWELLPRSAGIHALAIGATGGLIIAMITRTALGHTGRLLTVGRIEVASYVLVQLAAVVRVLTVAAFPAAAVGGIHLAATAWTLAFLLYGWRYAPFLWRARADGRPG